MIKRFSSRRKKLDTSFMGSVNESLWAWKLNYELVWKDDSESLPLPPYLNDAYLATEIFCSLLGKRVKGAGFLKTLLMKDITKSG